MSVEYIYIWKISPWSYLKEVLCAFSLLQTLVNETDVCPMLESYNISILLASVASVTEHSDVQTI